MSGLRDIRALVPALERVVYLDTAACAPAVTPVLRAMRRAEDEWAGGRFAWRSWEEEAHGTRDLFARLVGGQGADVALVPSVAHAAAQVAADLPAGRIVVGEGEFRSNFFPWLALRQRGFEIATVPLRDGAPTTGALVEAITPGTVLVAVSDVQSATGLRVALEEIGARCRRTGARLFVDGSQSIGALRFNAASAGVDYVAAHAYKWLLGTRGATWLWTEPGRFAGMRPITPSWKTVSDPYAGYYGGALIPAAGGPGLDAPLAWFPWVGARAALELVASLDAAWVEQRCLALARTFREEAAKRGFALAPQEVPSHIAAVRVPEPDAVAQRLRENDVVAAVRGGWLRLSFHAFNDETDVAAGLEALGRSAG
jgi:selenocysteine lyase/cysteine desulfurase